MVATATPDRRRSVCANPDRARSDRTAAGRTRSDSTQPDRPTPDGPTDDGTDASAQPSAQDMVALLERARAGDEAAWIALTDRFATLLASVARRYGLSSEDAADVEQTCWLRLLEHVDRIKDPARLAGWLQTVARHECWRVLRGSARHDPLGDTAERLPDPSPGTSPEDITVRHDAQLGVREVVGGLRGAGGRVLQALLDAPGASYADLSAALQMPIGSIGPTRGRALARLRTDDRILALAS